MDTRPGPEGHAHADLLPVLLTLDAVVHASVLREALTVVAAHLPEEGVASILDVGAGTGTGTVELALRYPAAHVVAVDLDAGMLERVRDRAAVSDVADRIDTLHADIEQVRVAEGSVDLVWSANALHEVAEPEAVLVVLLRSLRPGGLLAVVEMTAPPWVLPMEHAATEAALRAAATADQPVPDWQRRIAAAGFQPVETRTLLLDETLPADGPGGAYAALELRRLAHAAAALPAAVRTEVRDLVDDLTGPHERLAQVRIRGTRTLWVARRPADPDPDTDCGFLGGESPA